MPHNQWQQYERAYHLRSLKYADGKKLEFSRKHQGLAEYIEMAIKKIEKQNFSICLTKYYRSPTD